MEENGKVMVTEEAIRVVERYVCSRCWGRLNTKPAGAHKELVYCFNQNCDGSGFVTRRYADEQRAQDRANYAEVMHNLKGIIPGKYDGKSSQDLLNELGF